MFSATWISYFAYYFCRRPFYAAKGTLAEEHGWTADDLALVGTVYLVAYAVGQFASGALGTRTGPRVALLAGMGVTLIANATFGFVPALWAFALVMAVNGLAQATGWSNNVGTMTWWTRRTERATVLGVWGTNYQLGGILSNGMAAMVLGAWGFRSMFLAGSAVMLFAWLWCAGNLVDRPTDVGLAPIPDDPSSPEAEERGWTRDVVIDVAILGAFYFCIKFVRYAIWSWMPYIFETRFGLAGDNATYLSTLFDVGGFIGVLATGFVSDRFAGGRRAPVAFASVLLMVGACLLLFLGGTQDVTLCAVSLFLVGMTLYGPDALMSGAGAAEIGSRRTAVMAVGVVNGTGSIGPVVQELLLGRMLGGEALGPVFAVLLGSSVCAVAALGVLLVRGHLRARALRSVEAA